MRDVFVCEPELFDQPAQAACFFDGIEVGALQVLDEAEHQLLVAARFRPDHGGDRIEAGEPRRAPASLAGDQFEAVRELAYEQRLKDSVKTDRLRQLTERLGVEA